MPVVLLAAISTTAESLARDTDPRVTGAIEVDFYDNPNEDSFRRHLARRDMVLMIFDSSRRSALRSAFGTTKLGGPHVA
jgi:hypothetical protein